MTKNERIVYEAVKKNPGIRARCLPVQMWMTELSVILYNLEKHGIIYHELIQGEDCIQSHYVWYTVE